MSVFILVPILVGILAGVVVNYLADVLPLTLHLGKPVCKNPDCKRIHAWRDYLIMKPCRSCGKRRGFRTFAVLFLSVISSLYLWFSFPTRLGFALSYIVLTYLYIVAVIDLEHRLILRSLSLTGLVLAITTGWVLHGWLATSIGGLAGFSIMYVFYLLGKLFTRRRAHRLGQDPKEMEEALGSGDVTLATILGLLLGWPLIWFGLLMGALVAGVISLVIIITMLIKQKSTDQALMTFFPLGPAYIFSAIVIIYLPDLISKGLPN
jgi:leader peptidase (prepilin peptidase) / N-methyltransferase